MKNKLLVVSCAVSLLSCVAALASLLAVRAHAAVLAAPTLPAAAKLTIVAEDDETRVYTFETGGHQCFLASTRGGSGVSLQCPH